MVLVRKNTRGNGAVVWLKTFCEHSRMHQAPSKSARAFMSLNRLVSFTSQFSKEWQVPSQRFNFNCAFYGACCGYRRGQKPLRGLCNTPSGTPLLNLNMAGPAAPSPLFFEKASYSEYLEPIINR
jgi:hypothetical protein